VLARFILAALIVLPTAAMAQAPLPKHTMIPAPPPRPAPPAAASASLPPARLASAATPPLVDPATCRRGCARTAYFCRAADGPDCGDAWSQCVAACSLSGLARTVPAPP
jgi:hypothetical protein